ncbi:MAG UNVERIFIED_CONTAM: hypothetical protein LVR18_37940 [Planctomycetaceae bacterium]
MGPNGIAGTSDCGTIWCAWQDREGDAAGSWAPRDRSDTSVSGGRLLTTCLAALTLQVYYRNQPIFDEEAGGLKPATEVTSAGKSGTDR